MTLRRRCSTNIKGKGRQVDSYRASSLWVDFHDKEVALNLVPASGTAVC